MWMNVAHIPVQRLLIVKTQLVVTFVPVILDTLEMGHTVKVWECVFNY